MIYKFVILLLLLLSCQSVKVDDETKTPTLEKATVVSYENLDTDKFKISMKDTDVVIIDVRTPEEIAEGKIENALELNFYDKSFADSLYTLDREKTYLVYCKAGSRSAKTARLMVQNGFQKVGNLDGGYTAWKKSLE